MKISIIIVSYNRFDLLAGVLAELTSHPPACAHEVIVVDNGSTNDVRAFLAGRCPQAAVIANGANLGFARASNIGAARARGDYLLFLNSDAFPRGDALARLAARLDAEPDIGVIGPLLLNPDGSFQLSFGRPISVCSEFDQKFLAARRARRRWRLPANRDLSLDVGWVSGACLLTRRELFPGGRVFDEAMFLYFEDHELCLRVAAMGRRVVFWSAPAVVHEGGGSGGARSARAQLEYRRSQIHLYRRHAGAVDRWLLRLYLNLKCRLPGRGRNAAEREAIAAALRERGGEAITGDPT